MKISVTMNYPETADLRFDGRIMQQVVIREAEHEMTVIAYGSELQEVLTRLQGMPGVPDLNPSEPVTVTLARLDPNFPRKLDID